MGEETGAVDHGLAGEPPGLSCFHPGLLTETLGQAVGREQRALLLPNHIQSVCFQMRNCPRTMPEGVEGWRQSGADSCWRVEPRPGTRPSLSRVLITFLQLMHNNLPRTETPMPTTGGAGTLGDSEGERHWCMACP